MTTKLWKISARFTHKEVEDFRVQLSKKYVSDSYFEAQEAFFGDLDNTGLQEELNIDDVSVECVDENYEIKAEVDVNVDLEVA